MSDWTGLTGSTAMDVAACPPRLLLPKAKEPAGEAAERGTNLHLYAQKMQEDPENREQHLLLVEPEWRHTAEGMNIAEALDGIEVRGCEIAFVLNVESCSCYELGGAVDRDYAAVALARGTPLGRYDIPFTVDVYGWSTYLDIPVELDYKSGRSVGEVEFHGQRRISAAGLMLHLGTSECLSRIGYIWDDGHIHPDGHTFDIMDAYALCEYLKKQIDVALAVDVRKPLTVYPDPEKQCKYCPAYDACPYQQNLLYSVIRGETTVSDDPEKLLALTPTEKGDTMTKVKEILKAFTELEKKIRAAVINSGDGFPTSDGKEWYSREQAGRKSFDAAKARGKLFMLLSQEMDEEAVEKELDSLMKQGPSYPVVTSRKRQV